MICPCKDCEFRHFGCHAKCEHYKAWHTERQKAILLLRKHDDAVKFQIDGRRKAQAIAYRHKPK